MGRKESSETAGGEKPSPRTSRPLPTITHLQFLVLDLMRTRGSDIASQQLQNALSEQGVEQHGPKFYQLMKRLEESGMIESYSQAFDVAGSEVQRTFYKATQQGLVAWRITREFYATRLKVKNGVSKQQ